MFEIGRLCMKIAGRDAGKICVVIDTIDDKIVMIDGQTRRRKCNINHLELLDKTIKISKNASNKDIVKTLKELNIECLEKTENKKIKTTRPKKQKVIKSKLKKKNKTSKNNKNTVDVETKTVVKKEETTEELKENKSEIKKIKQNL